MAYQHISSRDNPLFKQLKALSSSSRERRSAGKLLLDGAHLLEAYLQTFGEPELLVISEGDIALDVMHLLDQLVEIRTITMPASMFGAISPVKTPTGILALVKTPALTPPEQPDFVLMLESIQDPGNLGSLLRNAAAAGVDVVYLSEGCTEAWSPRALRGGQGAHFVLPIVEQVDLPAVIRNFEGQTLATTMHGASLYDQALSGRVAFVIGNEGAGLSQAVIDAATTQVTIPMPGKVESLNAAAAAAVCLFERVRQTRAV
ncbi:MAG: RNA methyltransferase [Betaproteobacteria bacterium HGW-Betaproteobacteria-2]|nr:MAG: RNA methyltransferase [Betaproteobacteria bacterium HGW-Betaproteobacteria-2]